MKKLILIIISAVVAVIFSSCNKNIDYAKDTEFNLWFQTTVPTQVTAVQADGSKSILVSTSSNVPIVMKVSCIALQVSANKSTSAVKAMWECDGNVHTNLGSNFTIEVPQSCSLVSVDIH